MIWFAVQVTQSDSSKTMVSFPDLGHAGVTFDEMDFGEDLTRRLLTEVIEVMIDAGLEIPHPHEGGCAIELHPTTAIRLALYWWQQESGLAAIEASLGLAVMFDRGDEMPRDNELAEVAASYVRLIQRAETVRLRSSTVPVGAGPRLGDQLASVS